MSGLELCGGCGEHVTSRCRASLARAGLLKIHWECWSACNLRCPFCFRTTGEPIVTAAAERLIRIAATSGVEALVFAGGDPLLRPDLRHLAGLARQLGLGVEIHTNAHAIRPESWEALLISERVCLSLDGPTAKTHDQMRRRKHNFDRVLTLLARLAEANVPVSIRTLVSLANYAEVPDIAPIIANFPNVLTWTLQEFTAVNQGWVNRDYYLLPSQVFEHVVTESKRRYAGSAKVYGFRTIEKVGAYMMVSPDAMVYGTTEEALFYVGRHRYIGCLLGLHLADLVDLLPIDVGQHRSLYGWESAALRSEK
jgi:MoaA/NifB/PqqE/SkfB family radical SAM enzyme